MADQQSQKAAAVFAEVAQCRPSRLIVRELTKSLGLSDGEVLQLIRDVKLECRSELVKRFARRIALGVLITIAGVAMFLMGYDLAPPGVIGALDLLTGFVIACRGVFMAVPGTLALVEAWFY